MNDNQLQALVEEISLRYFQKPFVHKAAFNSRLRTTGGRYMLRTGNIEINKKYLDVHGEKELEGIVKHELCHYHLHQNKLGYQHKDRDFKLLAAKVGAPRFCTPLPNVTSKKSTLLYQYRCSNCSYIYNRKRQVDTKKFVCGKCKGRLKLVKMDRLNVT